VSADPRLTLHEQVLVNAASFVAHTVSPNENTELMLDTMRKMIPAVRDDHSFMWPVAVASLQYVDTGSSGPDRCWARYRLQCALARFHIWRCGLAQEALNKKLAGAEAARLEVTK